MKIYELSPSKHLVLFACTLAVCLSMVGCGQVDERPERYPAGGTVMQGGQPVAGAAVSFVPKTKEGTPAFGTTDDSGTFTLTTFDPDDGALPGDYYVKVEKYEESDTTAASDTTPDSGELDDSAYQPEEEGEAADDPKNLLPAKYSDPYNSGLEFTVKASESENNFEITLD